MPIADLPQLVTKLTNALSRTVPVLFVGAGVGKRVGYPDWKSLLGILADASEKYGDPDSATLIRSRAQQGRLLEAASVYKTADIPLGERMREMAAPFIVVPSESELAKLDALVSLPVSAFITTNYDNSLHRALTKNGRFARPVEVDDGSLTSAALSQDLFVARIHGRAESPNSLVLDMADYDALRSNSSYLDFLLDVFQRRSCIFIGFSFVDPAIAAVLSMLEEKYGNNLPKLHCAFVPESAGELRSRLNGLNIETIVYSEVSGHEALWRAIREAQRRLADLPEKVLVDGLADSHSLGRYMAFAYAQATSERTREPVVEMVLDGVVLSEIGGTQLDKASLTEAVAKILRLDAAEAAPKVEESLGRLLGQGRVLRDGDAFSVVAATSPSLEDDLKGLATNVVDRLAVRGLWADRGDCVDQMARVLEELFVARAWDVAAHYAGATSGFGKDLGRVAEAAVRQWMPKIKSDQTAAVASAVVDLLWHPEPKQIPILHRIGRAGFGLQLLLASPRQALLRQHAIPEKIYLDANVVLPVVTKGHPFQLAYASALQGLHDAALAARGSLEVIAGEEFLNEVVSHRRLAVKLVVDLGLEDAEELRDHVLFHGPSNTNVFVGAYASLLKDGAALSTFSKFLEEVAPYETEAALSRFLGDRGIKTMGLRASSGVEENYWSLLGSMENGYAAESRTGFRAKDSILIQHEAAQLARLRADFNAGSRAIFVSADSAMTRILRNHSETQDLGQVTISPLGLVALVDVLVGLSPDDSSLARLAWAPGFSEAETRLFDYFVAVGVRQYHEGIGLGLEDAARRIASEAAAEAKRRGLRLFSLDAEEAGQAKRLVDHYEDRFFESWREAVEDARKQST